MAGIVVIVTDAASTADADVDFDVDIVAADAIVVRTESNSKM